jgi:hypothetical protein
MIYQWFGLKTTGMIYQWLGLKTKTTGTVCQWFGLKTTGMVSLGLTSKPVATDFLVCASKPATTV